MLICENILAFSQFSLAIQITIQEYFLRLVLDMYAAILNMLENNYPETLQASYIINCEYKYWSCVWTSRVYIVQCNIQSCERPNLIPVIK